jgi:hypothetical protein
MSKANKRPWCLKPKQPKKHWGAKVDNGVCTQGEFEHKLKQSELSSFIMWYNLNLGKWYENVRIAMNFLMLIDSNIYAKGQRFHASSLDLCKMIFSDITM